MKQELVSIIVPVYNAEKYLHRCIDSILVQTFQNFEVILIDDGSKDGSLNICKGYALKDKRIKLICNENMGVSFTRNCGLKLAQGIYVQFVDADDYLDFDCIEKNVKNLEPECQLLINGYRIVNARQQFKSTENYPKITGTLTLETFKNEFGLFYAGHLVNPVWNKLYLLDIIKKNDITFSVNKSMGEDLLFNLDYFKHCQKINVKNIATYNYMDFNSNSLTNSYKKNYYEVQRILQRGIKEFLGASYNEISSNIEIIENVYGEILINCMNNLFHTNSGLQKPEIFQNMRKIFLDDFFSRTSMNHYLGNSRNRLILRLAIKRRAYILYAYFKLKNGLTRLRDK